MRVAVMVATFLAGVALPLAGQGSVDPVFGYWETQNRRAIVEIAPCGAEACGRLVWIAEPVDDRGAVKRDADGRPLCGIGLVSGLRRAEPGRWEDGEIYNPRDGRTYSARVEARDTRRLEVRGYAGIQLFGKSQIWTRAAGDRGGCASG